MNEDSKRDSCELKDSFLRSFMGGHSSQQSFVWFLLAESCAPLEGMKRKLEDRK